MAVEALLQDQSKPFHRTYNPYGCLKSQATADTCLFATRLSKSVLLVKGVKAGVFGQEAAAFLLHQGHAERSITL